MIFPEQFHFLRPWWLLAFVPLIWIVWRIVKSNLLSLSWEAVVDRQLLPYLLVGSSNTRDLLASILLGLCGALAIFSLAGPVWEKLPQPVFSAQSALVIALDLSRSMNAADIAPSRLERARFKIADMLGKRAEGQTALLAFAGDAFAVTPLTSDVATIVSQLQALTTDIMPVQGSRPDAAIKLALDLLKNGGAIKGDILLISDEVDVDQSAPIIGEVTSSGYRLSILGVGTENGAPIAKPDGGFMTDYSGNIIVPVLNAAPMQQLVVQGGGRYVQISLDDSDVDSLHDFFSSGMDEGDMTETEFETDVWHEQGPWLLIVLIPLSALVFRRGYLIVLVIALLPYPQSAEALDWDSLWSRSDQRAMRLMEEGDAVKAAELFEDPAWKGAAHYRAGNFEESAKVLEGLQEIENTYNQANAFARKGLFKEAIALYDKVLSANPGHEDAKFNKKLLEKEQQQQQPQQQEQQNQEDQHKDENQEEEEQNQQQNKQQEEGQKEQQQSEQQQQDQNQDQQKAEQQQQQQQQQEQAEAEEQEQSETELPKDEEKQATEQWLRRIPDDPGGLLRRKFLYQYQQRDHDREPGEKTW